MNKKFEFKEISDIEIWNGFLSNLERYSNGIPRYSFIQSFEWKSFQESLARKVLNFGVYADANLIGLGMGVLINAKRGNYLYFRHGPVIDWEDTELVHHTVKYLKDYAKKNNLWFIRISPLIQKNSLAEQTIKSLNTKISPMNDVEALDTWLMPLDYDFGDLQKQSEQYLEKILSDVVKKKTRYYIRKALKDGAVAEIHKDPKMIDEYYEILKDTVKRQGWNSYSKEYIKKEFEAFAKTDSAFIVLIKFKEKYIAGGVFIADSNQTYYHYGASMTEFKHIPASYLMIWAAIEESLKRNHKYFNFWGIVPEGAKDHPWQGLSDFKMKFPGFAQRWTEARDIPTSPKYLLTNAIERVDKIRKGY